MTNVSPPPPDQQGRLSEIDAETLAVYVAELSAAGLPLAPALRAAAQETGGRLAGALHAMAEALDRGQPLEDVLGERASRFPPYLKGLVQAALRTGNLGETLVDLVDHRRVAREQWQTVTSALAYPAILLALTMGMFLALSAVTAPAIYRLLEDLQRATPATSHYLIWVGRNGVAPLLAGMGALVALAVLVRLAVGRVRWRRMVTSVPLFGPLWHWSAVAEMARMLASLIKRRTPAPAALRLTAAGLYDANVAAACRDLADGVENGRELAELIVLSPRLPATLAPLVRWGERTGQLGEALDSAAEMFEGRVRLRASLLRSILPPFVVVIAAVFALAIFVGFVAPLIVLIQDLT